MSQTTDTAEAALALYPEDLDLTGGGIRVLRGKGGRSRVVGIDPAGASIVAEWTSRCATLCYGAKAPFFCIGVGSRMSSGCARWLLAQLGRSAGIEKRVHPHGLRHSHVVELRAGGVDICVISKQLGHRTNATTARCLDHIAPLAVVEAMHTRALWL